MRKIILCVFLIACDEEMPVIPDAEVNCCALLPDTEAVKVCVMIPPCQCGVVMCDGVRINVCGELKGCSK